MASQSKTQTVKFEVGNYVLFSGHRVGRVSRIAKNGAIYVSVLGETTVADQTREELRVKKADLQLVSHILERTGDAVSVEDYVSHVIRDNISCVVSSNASLADNGAYELAPDYIPSPGCLAYCAWDGSKAAQRVMRNLGIDLVKRANLYTGNTAEAGETAKPLEEATTPIEDTIQSLEKSLQSIEDTIQSIEEAAKPLVAPMVEPIQSALSLESTEESQSVALAEATYALRELTFSVTRHSILTAFIDMALNKNIPGYNYKVASNIKNLMAAAFDPVHDSVGYARINNWTKAALELLVKNKDRIAKMLSQPIEAAPIKIDRVTKLGMWLDKNMMSKGAPVDDLTAAYDSCYMYDAIGKKLEACTFVVVEVIPSGAAVKVKVIKDPTGYYTKHLTAQSAISARQQHGNQVRRKSLDWRIYCGIVPILKTGLAMQAAIEDTMASAIDSLKGIK